jgi:hypothetical protein
VIVPPLQRADVSEEEEEEKEEEEVLDTPRQDHPAVVATKKRTTTAQKPPAAAKKQRAAIATPSESDAIVRWTADLNDILARANQPMVQFLGALAATLRTDPRYLMTWDANAVGKDASERVNNLVRPATSVPEWLALNRDLGSTLLLSYLESVSGSLENQEFSAARIGEREHDACFDLRELDTPSLDGVDRVAPGAVHEDELAIARLEAQLEKKVAEEKRTDAAYIDEDDEARSAELLVRAGVISGELRALRAELARLRDRNLRHVSVSFLHKATELLKASHIEVAFAPAWAWECMGSAVWRRFVRMDALAAVAKAHALVNSIPHCSEFTEKELICSHSVFGNFSFLVAYQYLATTDCVPSAPQGRNAAGGGRSGNMTYVNIEHLRRTLAMRVQTCKVWFETHVHRRPNPLLAAFDRKQQEMISERPELERIPRWLEAMKRYRSMMPAYELVAVEPMDQ